MYKKNLCLSALILSSVLYGMEIKKQDIDAQCIASLELKEISEIIEANKSKEFDTYLGNKPVGWIQQYSDEIYQIISRASLDIADKFDFRIKVESTLLKFELLKMIAYKDRPEDLKKVEKDVISIVKKATEEYSS